tara:strand:- start:662 stop:1066 length:405 start_codon:yes stop_codon:yes gene_type:complete
MAKRLIVTLMVVVMSVMSPATNSFAQSFDDPALAESTGTRKQIATIIFAGLAGAILGLSTLSFYGRPQDKLSNIAIGFALGVIAGATYTTYKTATRPYDYYGSEYKLLPPENSYQSEVDFTKKPNINLAYSWEF